MPLSSSSYFHPSFRIIITPNYVWLDDLLVALEDSFEITERVWKKCSPDWQAQLYIIATKCHVCRNELEKTATPNTRKQF
jgi:hypothetical protein